MAKVGAKRNWQKVFWCILGGIAISMIVLLVLMALYNQPIADQLSFMLRVRQYGVVGQAAERYQVNGGRMAQMLGIGLAYKIFGEIGTQVVIPILLLTLLAVSLYWLFSMTLKKNDVLQNVILSILSAGIILYVAPCLFDIYLWIDADFVHLMGLIAIIIDIDIFIWFLKNPDFTKRKFLLSFFLFLLAYNQLYIEITMALMFGWACLFGVATLVHKDWHKYRKTALTILIPLAIGSVIMVAAPGTWARSSIENGGAGLFEIFIKYPMSAYIDIAKNWSLWQFCGVVVLGYVIGKALPKNVKTWQVAVGGILGFLSVTYIAFAVTFFGQKYGGMASRTMFVPNFGYILLIISGTIIAQRLISKIMINQTAVATAMFLVFGGCFMFGFLKYNRNLIQILTVRDNAVKIRMGEVEKYQLGESEKLVLPDLPVMIKNSDASDFTVNNTTIYDWYYSSFAQYYKINKEDLTIVGGEVYSPWHEIEIPAWYSVEKIQLCVEGNELVAEKYLCKNL